MHYCMATYKLGINPLAISDILAIKAYTAEDNPDAAKQMAITIYNKIQGLCRVSRNWSFPKDKNQ